MLPETQLPMVSSHMAVSVQDCIVVFGGNNKLEEHSWYVIYVYNKYTEQWKKCKAVIPEGKTVYSHELLGCCAMAVSSDIYVFGVMKENTSTLWKLRRNRQGFFSWSEVIVGQAPSYRSDMTGWVYAEKLWTFGGYGVKPATVGHLNEFGDFNLDVNNEGCNSQLLCFDLFCIKWSNRQGSGTVPSPRFDHASTILDDKVWLYGGSRLTPRNQHFHVRDYLHDLYVLSMTNLTWTQIQTEGLIPVLFRIMSLNAIADTKLAFHCSQIGSNGCAKYVTWILDISEMACRNFTASTDDEHICGQTGTSGLYGSVVVIGGVTQSKYIDPFCIRLEPQGLQQLAIKIIHRHQENLPFQHLPPKLILKIRDGYYTKGKYQ